MTTTATLANAFQIDLRATLYRQPIPAEVHPLIEAEAAEYRAAYEALDELESTLTDIDGQIADAEARDRNAVRQAAQAGTLADLPTLRPHYDGLLRTLAEAHAQHPDAARRALNANSALSTAIDRHRDAITADLEADLQRLADLAAPFKRALSAIAAHSERAAQLHRWTTETTGRDLASYAGRPASALAALPAPLKP